MALCTDVSFVNAGAHDGEIRGLRCKRWSCDICRPFNRQRVMHVAKSGKPNIFLTLTCNPGRHEGPDQAARDMVRGLVLLRRRLGRMGYGEKIPFIVVFEAHQSGWPHMHLLIRSKFIPWQKLRAIWEEISGAFRVDIRQIKRPSQALFYVTKYIGKELRKYEGCKRWWRSQNYSVLKEEGPKYHRYGSTYHRVEEEFTKLISKLRLLGYPMEKTGPYSYYIPPDFVKKRDRINSAILAAVRWYPWSK